MYRAHFQGIAGLVMILSFLAGLLACHLVHGQQLPPQAGPLNVPPTTAEINLGRMLFFDPILSVDNTISCSTCHDPNMGWTDGKPVAVGINGSAGTRNTPTLLNVGYVKPLTFWDGRAVETSDQAVLPLTNPREMGQQTLGQVVQRLRLSRRYLREFAEVFEMDQQAGSPVTATNLARAIASFESVLNTSDAPIDRFMAGNLEALTPDARIGFELVKKADCFVCHPPPFYTDGKTHNIGAEFATRGRITDRGRAIVTNQDRDVAAFKTPTLRGIAQTAPYMHNGQMPTLERVVKHFNVGGHISVPVTVRDQYGKTTTRNDQQRETRIDPRVRRLGWTDQQEQYVVKFLLEAFEGADYPLIGAP